MRAIVLDSLNRKGENKLQRQQLDQLNELDVKKALILGQIVDSLSPLVDQITEDGLTKNILNLIVQLLDSFSEGKIATVAPYSLMIGTEAAAEVLGVSRQWLTKLIDRGDLPAQLIGSKKTNTTRRFDGIQKQRQSSAFSKSPRLVFFG